MTELFAQFPTPGGWVMFGLLLSLLYMLVRLDRRLGEFVTAARDLLSAAKTERGTAELVRADAKDVAAQVLHSAAKVATAAAVEIVNVVAGGDVHKPPTPGEGEKA